MVCSSSFCYSQQTRNVSPAGTKYFLYTPPGYSSGSTTYPLLVSLHGQVGIGNDLDEILQSRDETPAKLIEHGRWPASYPFIVLSPQLERDHSIPDPRDQDWDPDAIDEVIEHVKSTYAVDINRIYFVGLSLGASGVWLYGAAFPEKVAAMVPISGVPDSTQGCLVKDIPTWVFHGENDGLIEPVFATGMVNAINSCQPPGAFTAHLTLMRARRHEGWSEVFNDSNGYQIYDWLLTFNKDDQSNKSPYVNAGSDLSMIQREDPVHLYGEFFDPDGTIANVEWKQASGTTLSLKETSSRLLTITNALPGQFEFELTATDNEGAQQSDRVTLEIVPATSSTPAVTDLFLLDADEQMIAKLEDGFVINPSVVGNEINIRAEANAASLSVRFRINNDHNTRTINTPGPYLISSQQWYVNYGDYLLCATPFDSRGGRGNSGISQCYKIIVSSTAETPPDEEEPDEPVEEEPEPPVDDPDEGEDPPGDDGPGEDPDEPPTDEDPPGETPQLPRKFFAITGSDIGLLSSWNTNADGSGSEPTSFGLDGQQFAIPDSVLLLTPLTVSGVGATLVIKEGGTLVVRNALSSPVSIEANATLYIDTSAEVKLGNIDPQSTIVFEEAATAIPMTEFGTVHLRGNGSVKNLGPGQTKILGELVIDDGAVLAGASDLSSTLAISGDIYIDTENNFQPQPGFSLLFEKAGTQTIHSNASEIVLTQINISSLTEVRLASTVSILKLGSLEGGGLTVASGGKLLMGTTDLSITGAGVINANEEGGEIAFNNSDIRIESTSLHNSHLSAILNSDSVSTLMANLQGAGQLYIDNPLFVTDRLNLINGSIHSNGNIVLVSDSTGTAIVAPNDGSILGDVHFQRFLSKGFETRYVTFPLENVTLSTVRISMPSKADTTASLSEYDDSLQGFSPLSSTGSSDLTFAKGYALQLPDTVHDYLLTAPGRVNNSEASFSLTPNPATDPVRGWNLLGNPFLAPIEWRDEHVAKSGVSSTIQILDHQFPFERYLVWDGETGDEEFSGIVSQGQAFFVQTLDATPLLTLEREAIKDTSANMRATTTKKQFSITLKRNNVLDRTYLKFLTDGNDSIDSRDGGKRRNGYFSLSTLSADSISLAINSLSEVTCEKSIGLLLNDAVPGEYSLAFNGSSMTQADWTLRLVDTEKDSTLSITNGSTYNFEITNLEVDLKRFLISIASDAMPNPLITVDENIFVSNYENGNQWLLDGQPIPNATGQVLEPQVSGNYSLMVSDNGCVGESQPIIFSVTDLMEFPSEVKIFPNPAHKSVQVKVSNELIGANIKIINMVGVSMVNAIPQTNEFRIDLEFFNPGVYIIIISRGRQIHQRKLVVR